MGMQVEELKRKLEQAGEVRFSVKVIPKASRSEVAGEAGEGLRARVQAPPERGRANQELVRLLAELFGVPRRNVELLAGETSTVKQVRVRRG